MMLALCSAKGSPGVSMTGLALTLTWPGRVILAECDPAGGDLTAAATAPMSGRGVCALPAAVRRGELREWFWPQLVDLDPAASADRTRLLLPGPPGPGQPAGLGVAWSALAAYLHQVHTTAGFDVLVDCGRLATVHPPLPLLAAADLVFLVVRPTRPAARAAAGCLGMLTATRTNRPSGGLALLVVDDGAGAVDPARLSTAIAEAGGDSDRVHAARLWVVGVLPHDPASAVALGRGRRPEGRLLDAAAAVAAALHTTGPVRIQVSATHGSPAHGR